MQASLYHLALRTTALTLALLLLFDSGLLTPATKLVSQNTQQYLAQAIGMTAAITPNDVNEITAGLTARETELSKREAALKEREIAVDINRSKASLAIDSTFILSVLVFLLLVLIVINYILDFLRGRSYLIATKYETMG